MSTRLFSGPWDQENLFHPQADGVNNKFAFDKFTNDGGAACRIQQAAVGWWTFDSASIEWLPAVTDFTC